jgi:hypothetical protein
MEDEMVVAYSTNQRDNKCTHNFVRKPDGRDNSEDRVIGRRIILKRDLKATRCDYLDCIHLSRDRDHLRAIVNNNFTEVITAVSKDNNAPLNQ